MSFTINILSSATSSQKSPLEVDSKDTIAGLKGRLRKQMDIDEAQGVRLIFAGRILKDDDTVEQSKLQEGSTVHLVRLGAATAAQAPTGAPSATATTAASTTSPPLSSNPILNSAMFRGAPMGGSMPAAAPLGMGNSTTPFAPGSPSPAALDAALAQNPELMRQSMELLISNPQLLQGIMNSDPRFAGMPAEVRQMMGNPEVLRAVMTLGMAQQNAAGGNATGGSFAAGFPGMPLFSDAPAAQEPESGEPAEVRYKAQLEQLQEMGFWDKEENIRVLTQTRGNVHAAIERLFQNSSA